MCAHIPISNERSKHCNNSDMQRRGSMINRDENGNIIKCLTNKNRDIIKMLDECYKILDGRMKKICQDTEKWNGHCREMKKIFDRREMRMNEIVNNVEEMIGNNEVETL